MEISQGWMSKQGSILPLHGPELPPVAIQMQRQRRQQLERFATRTLRHGCIRNDGGVDYRGKPGPHYLAPLRVKHGVVFPETMIAIWTLNCEMLELLSRIQERSEGHLTNLMPCLRNRPYLDALNGLVAPRIGQQPLLQEPQLVAGPEEDATVQKRLSESLELVIQ